MEGDFTPCACDGNFTPYTGDGNDLLDVEDYGSCDCDGAKEGETCGTCLRFCRVTMPLGAKKIKNAFNHEFNGILVEKALLGIMFAYWYRPISSASVLNLCEQTDDRDMIIAGESVRKTVLSLICSMGHTYSIDVLERYGAWHVDYYTVIKVVRYTLEEHPLFQRDETHNFLISLQ
jgi:hypothetical protein